MWRVQGGKGYREGEGRAKGGIREKGEGETRSGGRSDGEGEKRLSNQGHFMQE